MDAGDFAVENTIEAKNGTGQGRIKKIAFLAAMGLLAIVLVTALAYFGESYMRSTRILKSSNGRFEATLSSGWIADNNLDKTAMFGASKVSSEMYFIAELTNKKDIPEDTTLEDYYKLVSEAMVKSAKKANLVGPSKTKVSGLPALQYELHGEVDNAQVSYLITLVETKNSFCELITWTQQSRYKANKAELLKMTNGFKEVPRGK